MNEKSYFFSKKNKNLEKYFSSYFIIFDLQDLREILINFSITSKEIYLDPNKTPYFIENFFKTIGVKVKYSQDPCENLKLIKNPIEIKGFKSSHIRDGVSVCKFLFWLDGIIKKNKKVSEIITSKKLFEFRKKNKLFRGLSFETISSFGSNGSIIHYRVSTKTNKILKKNNLYLYDSGAQYLDGTTDVTRTICIGDNPTQEQKDRFTRVLKGNLGLSHYSFNDRTTGSVLDKIARRHLKKKTLITNMEKATMLKITNLLIRVQFLSQKVKKRNLKKKWFKQKNKVFKKQINTEFELRKYCWLEKKKNY